MVTGRVQYSHLCQCEMGTITSDFSLEPDRKYATKAIHVPCFQFFFSLQLLLKVLNHETTFIFEQRMSLETHDANFLCPHKFHAVVEGWNFFL